FRKISAILLVGLSTISAYGQYTENLVSNGSFEAIDGKIKGLKGIDIATGWTSPTGVPSDLFGPVKAKGSEISPANVPDNVYGKEDAKDGSNYAGIVAYSFGAKVPRSYILGKLDAPLKKGMRYCVKFNVSLAEASKYASNNIGISFTKKDPSSPKKIQVQKIKPQLLQKQVFYTRKMILKRLTKPILGNKFVARSLLKVEKNL
ncbi:MAG: hypothetical protein RJA13_2260, partial [Bacteroidota bacterium]